jgi:NitT/TauT family transport system substrate-binding protein
VVLALPALNLGFATSYIAEGNGYWKASGLNVKIVEITGIGAMNAVLSKSADFSNSSGATIIRAHIRGQKVLSIANTFIGIIHEIVITNAAAAAAGVTFDSPVEKRGAALKGKKIAFGGTNSIPHGVLRLLAKKGGLDPEREVQIALMQPEASIAAMKTGAIDGIVQSLPWSLLPPRQGTGVLLSSNLRGKPDFPDLMPQMFNGIVTRPDLCEQKPTVCARFAQGYVKAIAFMHERTADAVEVLRKRMPNEDPSILAESLRLMLPWAPKTPVMDDIGWVKSQELMEIAGMIKPEEKLKSFNELYTNKYVSP